MALTPIQRDVCQLLAESRVASSESYPGFTPQGILDEAARSGRYSAEEDGRRAG